jgi:hypothetical protein
MELKGAKPKGTALRGGRGPAAFFALALLSLWVSGCSDQPYKNCGTQITDPDDPLAGCVELENGQPAVAVRVVAVPSGAAAKTSALAKGAAAAPDYLTTHTDGRGLYRFDDVPDGDYSLVFEDSATRNTGEWRVGRTVNVTVKNGGKQFLPKVTLQRAGTLSVTVVDGGSESLVVGAECRVDGTPYVGSSAANGAFILYLPESRLYEMTCDLKPYTPRIIRFEINSGQTKSVKVQMFEGDGPTTIPPPTNLSAVLDTATGIVRVAWSNPSVPGPFEYIVKRADVGTGGILTLSGLGDTVHYDAVFGGDSATVTAKTMQYSVACVQRGKTGYFAFSKPLMVTRGPAARIAFLDTAKTSCHANDSISFEGSWSSRFQDASLLAWSLRGDILKSKPLSGREGKDTLTIPCGDPGDPTVELRVKDVAGVTAVTRLQLQVIPAP